RTRPLPRCRRKERRAATRGRPRGYDRRPPAGKAPRCPRRARSPRGCARARARRAGRDSKPVQPSAYPEIWSGVLMLRNASGSSKSTMTRGSAAYQRPTRASPPRRKRAIPDASDRCASRNTDWSRPPVRATPKGTRASATATAMRETRSRGRKGASHGTVRSQSCRATAMAACRPASGPANPGIRSATTRAPKPAYIAGFRLAFTSSSSSWPARRSITQAIIGRPRNSTSALSTGPSGPPLMRRPRPPASTTPVIPPGPGGARAIADCRSATDVGHLHLAQARRGARSQGGVAVVPRAPERADRRRRAGIGDTVPKQGAQVVAMGGEQAGEELALGGQACSRAVRAEWAGHGGNHADLAAAVAIAPAARHLAGVVGGDRLEPERLVDAADHLGA